MNSFRQQLTPKYLRKNRHYLVQGQLSSTTYTKVPSQKQTLFGAWTAFVSNLHQSTFAKTITILGMDSFRQQLTPKYLIKKQSLFGAWTAFVNNLHQSTFAKTHYLGHGQLSSATYTKVPWQKQTLSGARTTFVNNLHQSTFAKTDTIWDMVVNVSPWFGETQLKKVQNIAHPRHFGRWAKHCGISS